jgi:hypothetical protein
VALTARLFSACVLSGLQFRPRGFQPRKAFYCIRVDAHNQSRSVELLMAAMTLGEALRLMNGDLREGSPFVRHRDEIGGAS